MANLAHVRRMASRRCCALRQCESLSRNCTFTLCEHVCMSMQYMRTSRMLSAFTSSVQHEDVTATMNVTGGCSKDQVSSLANTWGDSPPVSHVKYVSSFYQRVFKRCTSLLYKYMGWAACVLLTHWVCL